MSETTGEGAGKRKRDSGSGKLTKVQKTLLGLEPHIFFGMIGAKKFVLSDMITITVTNADGEKEERSVSRDDEVKRLGHITNAERLRKEMRMYNVTCSEVTGVGGGADWEFTAQLDASNECWVTEDDGTGGKRITGIDFAKLQRTKEKTAEYLAHLEANNKTLPGSRGGRGGSGGTRGTDAAVNQQATKKARTGHGIEAAAAEASTETPVVLGSGGGHHPPPPPPHAFGQSMVPGQHPPVHAPPPVGQQLQQHPAPAPAAAYGMHPPPEMTQEQFVGYCIAMGLHYQQHLQQQQDSSFLATAAMRCTAATIGSSTTRTATTIITTITSSTSSAELLQEPMHLRMWRPRPTAILAPQMDRRVDLRVVPMSSVRQRMETRRIDDAKSADRTGKGRPWRAWAHGIVNRSHIT